jgi:hypothetical protein
VNPYPKNYANDTRIFVVDVRSNCSGKHREHPESCMIWVTQLRYSETWSYQELQHVGPATVTHNITRAKATCKNDGLAKSRLTMRLLSLPKLGSDRI